MVKTGASSKQWLCLFALAILIWAVPAPADQIAPDYPNAVPYPYYTFFSPYGATVLPYGISLVATGGDVTVTFVGNGGALFTDYLYLASPANSHSSPAHAIFNNQFSAAGSTVDLGSFARGTVLTFGLYVDSEDYDYPDFTYYTGPASLNPDFLVHAYVVTNYEGNPFATYVGFEDYYDFNYTDCQFIMTGLAVMDVADYVAASKGQLFDQLGSGSPVLETTGFTFQASVYANSANTLLGATDQPPSAVILTLTPTSGPGDSLAYTQGFTTKGALDSLYATGTYAVSILTLDDGILSAALPLPGDAYPNPPQIINLTAAQTVDSTTDFTITWGSFTNGTTNDLITLTLTDPVGNTITTPNLSEYGYLDGTATAYDITAGSLLSGTIYQGTLSFTKITDLDSNSIPGAIGITDYSAETRFSVTTIGTAVCDFAISPTVREFSAAGGSDSVGVTATGDCAWTATNNDSFLTITAGASGSGNGTVSYTVAANTNSSGQVGTLTIAGRTFKVVQSAAPSTCTVAPASTTASFSADGGSSNVAVIANAGTCTWAAFSDSSFIQITAGASGLGSGVVAYVVAANPDNAARDGTLSVAGQTFTVMQAANTCVVTPATTNASFAAAGGSGSVTVSANATNCPWSAASNDGFITITSGNSGVGNGTVSFTVAANTNTVARIGTLTVAGAMYTVTQAAGVCSVFPVNTAASFGAAGGANTISVSSSLPSCPWTATSNDGFITITAGSSGVGTGTVSYTVAANSGDLARSGTVTVAGQTFTVTQAAAEVCTFSLSAASVSLAAKGGAKSVSLKSKGVDCTWTAVSNDPFITITAGTSGAGIGKIEYAVAGNTNTSERSGTITIAGQTFTVNQAAGGCTFSLSPKDAKPKSTGGSATVKVKAGLSDCTWTAVSNDPFITIITGASGRGDGTVSYTIAPNTNTTAVTGTITIGGETFSVTQSGMK